MSQKPSKIASRNITNITFSLTCIFGSQRLHCPRQKKRWKATWTGQHPTSVIFFLRLQQNNTTLSTDSTEPSKIQNRKMQTHLWAIQIVLGFLQHCLSCFCRVLFTNASIALFRVSAFCFCTAAFSRIVTLSFKNAANPSETSLKLQLVLIWRSLKSKNPWKSKRSFLHLLTSSYTLLSIQNHVETWSSETPMPFPAIWPSLPTSSRHHWASSTSALASTFLASCMAIRSPRVSKAGTTWTCQGYQGWRRRQRFRWIWDEMIVESSRGDPTIQRFLVTAAQEPSWGEGQNRGTNQQQSTSSPNATYLGPAFSSTCTAYRVAATGLSQKKWRISCLLSNRQFSLEPGSWVIQPCQKEQVPRTFCKTEHDTWKHMILQYTGWCAPYCFTFFWLENETGFQAQDTSQVGRSQNWGVLPLSPSPNGFLTWSSKHPTQTENIGSCPYNLQPLSAKAPQTGHGNNMNNQVDRQHIRLLKSLGNDKATDPSTLFCGRHEVDRLIKIQVLEAST